MKSTSCQLASMLVLTQEHMQIPLSAVSSNARTSSHYQPLVQCVAQTLVSRQVCAASRVSKTRNLGYVVETVLTCELSSLL